MDNKRLGRQRVEAMMIVDVILKGEAAKGWKNHPAVNMWRNNIDALKLYHDAIVNEWIIRGFNNNMKLYQVDEKLVKMPWWFGSYGFHIAHQSNLMRKDSDYYRDYFDLKIDELDLPYVWPANFTEEEKRNLKKEIMKITIIE